MRFGNLGVGTSRAGFSFNMPSRTQYLKNERNAASFRAMELFSSPASCRWPMYSRMTWWLILVKAGVVVPGGVRKVWNCSRSLP